MDKTLDATALGQKLLDLCKSNNPDLTQFEILIKDGALVDFTADYHETPLFFAARNGRADIAELLLKNHANVNHQTLDFGWTPLLNAVESNHENVVHLLLDHEADPSLRKKNGATPFIVAAIVGNVNLLQTFLSLGADVDETDVNGYTAFMEAAQYDKKEALLFLFQQKADVNKHRGVSEAKKKVGKGGKTALMDAVIGGHEDIVQVLLGEMDAEVNALDNLGRTPLIHALEKDSQAIVETLLDHGADVNSMDKNRNTPLSAALTKTPLDISVVELLVKCGPNLNVPDNKGKTPLILAVEKKSKEVVQLLLEDQSVEINAQDEMGRTALVAAVENKDTRLTRMLCEKGADVHCSDSSANTPLMVASRKYDSGTKKVLIDHGAEKIKPFVKAPSRWKEHSKRWHGTLEKLQKIQRPPIGNLKLSRIEDFKITVNNGTEVYLGFHDHDIEVAVKCHRKFSEEAKKEKLCLEITRSDLFVKLVSSESDPFCDYLCLDLCEYNLEEWLERQPEKVQAEAPEIMERLVQALQILHSAKFAHRDLHPTNVLRDVENRVLLADFDKSVYFGGNATVTISSLGTWEASEILQKWEQSPNATFEEDELYKADLQALGRLLHYIMTGGKDPFRSEEDLRDNNPSLDEDLHKPQNAEVRHFIERLLAQAGERATLSDVKRHPFLWKEKEKSQFLQDLANEEDVTKRKQDSQIVQILNKIGKDKERSFHEWKKTIDPEVLQNMNMGQRKKPNKNNTDVYNNTTSDLLKFIRNLTQHFNEKPEEIQNIVGKPEEYCLRLFPDLTISIYNAVLCTKWKKHFP
ncbi:2-5A-dependent ribonuclease-like [Heptranchias perlo]|uniref:2-5A-dependent ribonuclease-like n=1 Tax=Heptranchias perlo TaxID=212740 RepID=UPI003559996F